MAPEPASFLWKAKALLLRAFVLGLMGNRQSFWYFLREDAAGLRRRRLLAGDLHYIKMAGNEVFKHAVRRMESACKECLEAAGSSEEKITYLIPHQANLRIIDAIAKRFEHLPQERIFKTVQKYGNTSASSIGIALDELCQKYAVQPEDQILLTAFGGGFTWGAALLKGDA